MRRANKISLDKLFVTAGDRILDLGCSSGTQAALLAGHGLAVHGVDNDFALAASAAGALTADGDGSLRVVVADAGRLPYADAAFDAAVSTEVFEHLSDPEAAARELARVVRRGGRVCIAVPTERSERIFRRLHPHWVEDSGHIQLFPEGRLLGTLETAGFMTESVHGENVEWTLFWIMHSLLRSRFDFTGTPLEHHRASRWFFRVWNRVVRTRAGARLMTAGNKTLPKSVYIYARRV